jgi:periplasmic protein CpxP/Spy
MFHPSLSAISTAISTALLLSMGLVAMPIDAIAAPERSQSIAQAPARPNNAQNNPQARDRWIKELNLSREQIQKIREIRDRYQDRLTQQRQAARQAQRELRELMSGNASTEQIRQKHEQVQTFQKELETTRMESMLAIREVLNPEQRQKLAETMRQRGAGARMVEGF